MSTSAPGAVAHRTYDAVIVGGGPAGLQAALTLGRMRREVVAYDSVDYRNAPARHMHNVATHDGDSPDAFRAAVRAEVGAYDTVRLHRARVEAVEPDGDLWRVRAEDLADGSVTEVRARTLLLATGVRDALPDLPGLSDLWGDVAAHCPYCHGHEFRGQHVAVLGSGPHVAWVSLLVSRLASRITVLADGGTLDESTDGLLADAGVAVRPERVTEVRRSGEGAVVSFAGGPAEEIGGLFVTTSFAQAAPFAEKLGLAMLPSGCVRVDELGRASRPGVYAAGDLAHVEALPMPLASVVTATAAGLVAATAIDQDLVARDSGIAPPA